MDNINSPFDDNCIAQTITDLWVKWDSDRSAWREEKQELREFLFATDTRKTSNAKLPWKNSTVTPKLTQIRDNLHANYMAALFPTDEWFVWDGEDKDSISVQKRRAITAYMRQKLKASKFELTVSQLVYDYIDYGNVFAGHTFVNETKEMPDTGELINVYTGPRMFRVSPMDVVMNPLATSFSSTPFIRRSLISLGDLIKQQRTVRGLEYKEEVVRQLQEWRASYRDNPDMYKNAGLQVDGFGNLETYVASNMVELLEYWGDVYDSKTGEYHSDVVCVVADRKFVLRNSPNKSWLGTKPFVHCGWRLRPDNLWAQGPLDQLIGMQYRIDHLENLKADVFDVIAYPVSKIKGLTVEEFEYAPGEQIYCGDEGDVEFVRPDTTALNADMQIAELMNRMEELAGAPKQAMGIRTPGEKTKYEVQTLENAAGRIFQSKVSWFERNVLEVLLNGMLEDARRNFGEVEQIKVIDEKYGHETFIEITKDDLVGSGKLFPVGARHFAEQAKFVQEMNNTIQMTAAFPEVRAHMSPKNLAKALEENLAWDRWKIFGENVSLHEQADTQRIMNQLQEDLQVEKQVPVEGGPV